jgi:hypothetical protein
MKLFRLSGLIMNEKEIPNLKNQITNNFQKLMNLKSNGFSLSFVWILKSDYWDLFDFWNLLFGISFQNSHLITKR